MASSNTHTARIIPISRKDYCTCTRLNCFDRRMYLSNDTSKFMADDCRTSWKAENLASVINSRIELNTYKSILLDHAPILQDPSHIYHTTPELFLLAHTPEEVIPSDLAVCPDFHASARLWQRAFSVADFLWCLGALGVYSSKDIRFSCCKERAKSKS